MTIDLRKVFKPKIRRLNTRARAAAVDLSLRWLDARSVDEREAIRREMRHVATKDKAIHVAALTLLFVAKVNMEQATKLARFLDWQD